MSEGKVRRYKTPSDDEDWEELILEVLAAAGKIEGFDELLEQARDLLMNRKIYLNGDHLENSIRQAFVRLQGQGKILYGRSETIIMVTQD